MADCYVSPYRAEGFNLPVLEAIACGTPVIVTEGGATDDFCPDGVAYRIPGEARATDDLSSGFAGKYIEPDFDTLVGLMDGFAAGRRLEEGRFNELRGRILEAFSWRRAANALVKLAAGERTVEGQGNKGHILWISRPYLERRSKRFLSDGCEAIGQALPTRPNSEHWLGALSTRTQCAASRIPVSGIPMGSGLPRISLRNSAGADPLSGKVRSKTDTSTTGS